MGPTVFNTLDCRGVKRDGKVQTFSGVTVRDEVRGGKGFAGGGALVTKVWGTGVKQWQCVELWVTRVLMGVYAVVLAHQVICPVAIYMTAFPGAGGSNQVDQHVVDAVVWVVQSTIQRVFEPVMAVVGLVTLSTSLACVAVMMVLRAEYGSTSTRVPDSGVQVATVVSYELLADVVMVFSAAVVYAVPSWVSCTFAVLAATYCAGIYHRVFLRRVSETRGELMEKAVMVVMAVAALFGPVLLVLVRFAVLRVPEEVRGGGLAAAGFPDTYRQINEVLGLDMSNAEQVFSAAEIRALYCGGTNLPTESAELRRLALVGDRVLSLALAMRAYRDKWTVGDANDKFQVWLSNSSLAHTWEVYLSSMFPQVMLWKESRKGTFVEALVGISYLSNGQLDNVERFILSRIAPVVVTRGGVAS